MKCHKCNKEQVYNRKDNGIAICCYCNEILKKKEKKPYTPYIYMDNNGHSTKRQGD